MDTDEGTPPVRELSWECDGPAELELGIDVGRVRIDLVDAHGAPRDVPAGDGAADVVDAEVVDAEVVDLDATAGPTTSDAAVGSRSRGEVRVTVRYDPVAGGGWAQGVGGLLNWLNASGLGGISDAGADAVGEATAAAVRAAEVTWSAGSRRLVVRSPQELPLRVVPLAVTVTAPEGSRLSVTAGSGDVTVSGRAGWASLRSGSGRVSTGDVTGDADVTTGSGDIEIGAVHGRTKVRSASGRIEAGRLHGTTQVRSGSGDVVLRSVAVDKDTGVNVRTGSGSVTVSDALAGRIDMTTGSGDLRIGVHPGVRAQLDLSSGSGRARSALEVSAVAPEQAAALVLTGRTGSGDVDVTHGPV